MTRADDIGLEWHRKLKFRRGGRTRLDGLEIFYDFNWREVFGNGRSQFPYGQRLAKLVRQDCPAGKLPALLLTTSAEDERCIYTNSHFVAVVNIPRYLAEANPDAAVSYYANRLGRGLTEVAQLTDIGPDVVRAVIEHQLTPDHIRAWASVSEERMEQLREIAGVRETDRPEASLTEALAALTTLQDLDVEIVDAIAGVLGSDIDREARLRFLRALTADRTGRHVTSEVLGQRLTDRLGDARAAIKEYVALLDNPKSGETALQDFIEANPWLLGLEYVKVRHRRAVPRGALDFILERYDGFHDLLELKSPQDPIIKAPDEIDGVPPSASKYTLSDDLAQALAQIHVYRDVLSVDAEAVHRRYGLRNTRDPRVIIVIGKIHALPAHRQRVLRELNLSLHRVEVAPYDLLADRANTVLRNIQRHLVATESDSASETAA